MHHKDNPQAILTLELKGAFDNVLHSAILVNLHEIGCGARAYEYVKDFLTNRTAKIKIGNATSDVMQLGDRGTPQGAVLSPLLFNLALIKLPGQLQGGGGVEHALYAHDITLWTRGQRSNITTILHKLQEAATLVKDTARSCCLACSPQKSELLLLDGHKRLSKVRSSNRPHIQVGSHLIPEVANIRILGLHLQKSGSNRITIKNLSPPADK